MFDQLETIDVYKVLASLAAGLVLGMEREMKDKAAGVKTISIICLGATLFAILSLRFDPDRATALAAYIVSGVGFLGAGVIFKDGVSISGLTTASIIWMAAAIGTGIGFGEFYLSGIFLLGCFVIIWVTPVLNKLIGVKNLSKTVTLRFSAENFTPDNEVMQTLRSKCIKVDIEKITVEDNIVELVLDLVIRKADTNWLGNFLLTHPKVLSFVL
jgi:putative Mg2+ transporter-C (MgtC) family protein